MKTTNMKLLRAGVAAASTCAFVGAFYGCSSDDNTSNGPQVDAGRGDAPADHSVADGANGDANGDANGGATDGANGGATDANGGGTDARADGNGNGNGRDGGDASAADGGVSQKVTLTKLFSNLADAGAMGTDPDLVNPWGLALNGGGTAWVANNGNGMVTTYTPTAKGTTTLNAQLADGGAAAPTGQIFNSSTTDFAGDTFIIATEDGLIQGWQRGPTDASPPTTFTTRVDSSAAGAIYKGLAIVKSTPPVLVAADFHNGNLAVFNSSYAAVTPDGGTAWTHPNLPTGYAPFNVVAVNGQVFVAYAKQDAAKKDDVAGAGNGFLAVYDSSGALQGDLIATGGELNAPWGIAVAPTTWGSIGGSLLVGNFGDGKIHAYDKTSGTLVGTLVDSTGAPLVIDGLWSLVFGVTAADAGETTSQLYFTAGPNEEHDGLFGFITPQ